MSRVNCEATEINAEAENVAPESMCGKRESSWLSSFNVAFILKSIYNFYYPPHINLYYVLSFLSINEYDDDDDTCLYI